MTAPKASCPLCGAPGVGGLEGCEALFGTLIGREFADPALFRAHRLTVDAYCLQHPERYMVSSKSAAAHLMGMCWSLEVGASLHLPAPIKAFVDGPRAFARVAAPRAGRRGAIHVTHLVPVVAPDAYRAAARQWAQSAWAAWAPSWPQARQWLRAAQGGA